jgi:predicted AlkP superfamily pyrophosphatase or phosphodiesterase
MLRAFPKESLMNFAARWIRASLVAGLAVMVSAGARAGEPSVVVMLFDGFSPQYIEKFPTPAFDRMRAEGAWSHAMDQAFPTISLIGATTISTGCWPEQHGIVTNVFLDPERGRYDHSSDADWLIGCEHMHQAAERQGLRSAAYGWVGRSSASRGAQASLVPESEASWQQYPDDAGRAIQVAELLALPTAERPRLILAYFKGPDGSGHFNGMESEETRAAVVAADAAVGTVLGAISALPDSDDVQLLVTTDHGMMPVEYLVNLHRILRRLDIEANAVSSGTTSFLYFDDPSQATLDDAFEKLSAYEEFDVVRREAQPPTWHIGSGPRVGQLIVSAHPPYFIEDPDSWPWFIGWLQYIGPDFVPSSATLKATHGYPAETPGVEGILYTRGSAFAAGREVKRARAIDIHPTVMSLLGLEPGRPVDGKVEAQLLR